MATETKTIRVGDYFESSWGYDQTNIDYAVVVKVSPTGKTVQCRMAEHIAVEQGEQSTGVMPGPAFGVTFRMHVRDGYGAGSPMALVGSYPYCQGTFRDGTEYVNKRKGWMFPVKAGHVAHETDPMFGH